MCISVYIYIMYTVNQSIIWLYTNMSKYHYTYLQISVYSRCRLVSFLPAPPEFHRINQSPGVRHWFSLSKKRSGVMKIFLIAGAFAITTPEGWVSNHLVADKNCLVRTNPTLLLNCSSFFGPKKWSSRLLICFHHDQHSPENGRFPGKCFVVVQRLLDAKQTKLIGLQSFSGLHEKIGVHN